MPQFAPARFRCLPARWPLVLILASLMAACGADDGPTEPSGTLLVTIAGAPGGGQVRVTGPAGYSSQLTLTTTLTGLRNGEYLIEAQDVSPLEVFAPATPAQLVSVRGPGANVSVTYTQISGALFIGASGVPPGAEATALVRGPNGYAAEVEAPRTVNGLLPGEYWVIPQPAFSGSCALRVAADSTARTVAVGQTASVTLDYEPESHVGYNMCIETAYLVQAVQRRDAGIPLVYGRDALLRVLVRGNLPSTAQPVVRAHFYENGTLAHSMDIPALAAVPTVADESSMLTTWNLAVPGALVTPSMSMLIELDPDLQVAGDVDRADNVYPRTGIPLPLDARSVPPLRVRLFPVRQTNTGNVSAANAADFLWVAAGLAPVGDISIDVGETFVTSAPEITSSNGNGAWQQILQELEAKRILEATPGQPQYHYAGVVRAGYTSGIAGMGYVRGWTSVIWDHEDNRSASWVLAHELGHNWGRLHVAGCQAPGGIDLAYPHAGASIGVFGFDLRTNTLYSPAHADIMSYCNAQWVSDYNYLQMMQYRGFGTLAAQATIAAREQEVMLVWGRVRNGQLVLEPSFITRGAPALPDRTGRYRLEGLDAAGSALFSFSFDPVVVAHADPPEQHFMFAVPLARDARQRLANVRVTGAGAQAVRALRRSTDLNAVAGVTATILANGGVELRWDPAASEALLVRDAVSRQVVAIGRGGRTRIASRVRELEIAAADAPAAASRRLEVRARR